MNTLNIATHNTGNFYREDSLRTSRASRRTHQGPVVSNPPRESQDQVSIAWTSGAQPTITEPPAWPARDKAEKSAVAAFDDYIFAGSRQLDEAVDLGKIDFNKPSDHFHLPAPEWHIV